MTNDMFQGRVALQELKKCGISYVINLPDFCSSTLVQAAVLEPSMTLVPVCREAEAFAIAAGLYIGGKESVIVIQNTGFFESGDSIRAISLRWKLPQLIMVGFRGMPKVMDTIFDFTVGPYTEPILKAWGLKYYLMTDGDNIRHKISRAYQEAHANSETVVVLIGGVLK